MNLTSSIKMSLKLAKLIFLLAIYLHMFGCCWYWLATFKDNWIPPLNYIDMKAEVYGKDVTY